MASRGLTMIDTASWIESLRENGRPDVKSRIDWMVRSGQAAWCALIRLESWNRRSGPDERRKLERMAKVIDDLPINDEVWKASLELAIRVRSNGAHGSSDRFTDCRQPHITAS